MTVKTDLASQRAPRSMLFAKIDGLEPILCEGLASADRPSVASSSWVASYFLAWSPTSKRLYRLPLVGGGAWEEFPVQPTIAGVAGYACCGTSDGRIVVGQNTTAMLHWDPATSTWESLAHPGYASITKISAAGTNGDMVGYGSGYAFTYTAATKTWAMIGGPGYAGTTASGSSPDDVWVTQFNGTTGYLYHWDGVSWSANLFPTMQTAIGFWPHVPRQVIAVSSSEVYFTTYPGSTAPWGVTYAEIIGWNGSTFVALNSADALPPPPVGPDGYPDCAPHAIDAAIWYDAASQSVYTSGNYAAASNNAVLRFDVASLAWFSCGGPWTQSVSTCTGAVAASGDSVAAYGFDTAARLRVSADGGTSWGEPTFAGADCGQLGLQYAEVTSTSWSTDRSLLYCLRAPTEEWSQGLDLGTMAVKPSSMTFELDDIRDPDAPLTSYFAKLFSSGRWSTAASTTLYPSAESLPVAYVAGDDDWIPVFDTTGFSATGTAYIGQETFSYTGLAASGSMPDPSTAGRSNFTGCTRARYPAVGTTGVGSTFRRPHGNFDSDGWANVTSLPYSWLGRMIALYIVTYDEEAAAWHSIDDAELLWCGRITDRGKFDPKRTCWQLVCQHIAQDLDRQICTELPSTELTGANFSGGYGRTFTATQSIPVMGGGVGSASFTMKASNAYITIAAGIYGSTLTVWNAVVDALASATWSDGSYLQFSDMGVGKLRVKNSNSHSVVLYLTPFDSRPGAYKFPSHVLNSCGFSHSAFHSFSIEAYGTVDIDGGGTIYQHYHPLSQAANGSKLACTGPQDLWSSQGDYGSTLAYASIAKAALSLEEEGTYLCSYTGTFVATVAAAPVAGTTIAGLSLGGEPKPATGAGFVGKTYGTKDKPVLVEQIWLPVQTPSSGLWRGPFEMLLFPLLSTGTAGVNHATYDALPLTCSLGIPAAIVDIDSFLDADKALTGTALADRKLYAQTAAIKMSELTGRECKLFGNIVAWNQGKLCVRSLRHGHLDQFTETLSDADKAEESEWPEPEWSADTVINCWKVQAGWNLSTRKYEKEYVVRNVRSIEALKITKSCSLDHPGICAADPSANVRELLEGELLGGGDVLGLPVDVVSASLAHTRMLRIAIGDVVLYTSSMQYDPFGSGLLSVSCYALVVDIAWSYARRRGRATLLLLGRYSAGDSKMPWGAVAMVDASAANGGWDAVNYRLTLVPYYVGDASTDSKDGYAFAADHCVVIAESNPADPNSPIVFHPLTVASTFETDGTNILTLEAVTLGLWDADKEWVVIPANYGEVTLAAQKQLGTWMAEPESGWLLDQSGNVAALKWG